MTDVYVNGVGMIRFGKREESLEQLVIQATEKTLKDAGLSTDLATIDAVFIGTQSCEGFTGNGNIAAVVTDACGLTPRPAMRIETASSTGAAVFQAAYFAVKSGHYSTVLVLAGEKMTDVPTPVATRVIAQVIDSIERKYGATMPSLAALATRRYMHEYGMTREALGQVAVKNHHNGTLNPYAQFQKEITLEKVITSRIIADPLRLFDCSPISDGACGLILSNTSGPVRVAGIGHATDHLLLEFRDSLTSFKSTRLAAKKAYDHASMTPGQIDIAEIHDAFTPFEIIGSEDVGFFKPGEGWKALVEGKTALDGAMPINPSGGLKARGHPVGVSGLAQIIEMVWQLRGEAGKRQVEGVKTALTQSIGGLAANNLVNILEAV